MLLVDANKCGPIAIHHGGCRTSVLAGLRANYKISGPMKITRKNYLQGRGPQPWSRTPSGWTATKRLLRAELFS